MANVHLDAEYDEAAYLAAMKVDFEARAPVYDSGANGAMHRALNKQLLELYPFQSPVLDVGCGTGYFCKLVAAEGGTITGIDMSAAMLREARRRLIDVGIGLDVRLVEGRAEALPFPDATFGSLYACTVLAYFPDIQSTLREFYRVLKLGGFCAYQASSGDSYVTGILLERACRRALGEEKGRKTFRVPSTVTDSEVENRALMTAAGFCDITIKGDTVCSTVSVSALQAKWTGSFRCAHLGRIERLSREDKEKVIKSYWECIEEMKEPNGTLREKVTSWFVQGWKREARRDAN